MSNKKKYKFIISGGGSGGHIYPALSIADSLKNKFINSELLFVGSKNRMEMKIIPDRGYKIRGLNISGFNRKVSISNLLLPFELIISLFQSLIILIKFRPNLVIGTGGFASGPILFVSSLIKIPTFIQEQNSYPGITNKILGKYSKKIFVAYAGMDKFFDSKKIIYSGNPVRESIRLFKTVKNQQVYKKLNLKSNKKIILVLGGSQGADKLNKSITDSIDFFIKNDLQVILQTGTRYYETYKKFKNKNLIIVPFVDKIEELYSITDLIVSRSGASIISELCIVGKPVIFVPSPNVVDDHQTKNARSIYDNGACEFINEDELDFKLTPIINKLIVSDIYRINLSEKIKAISKKNAVKIILSEIESFLK
ncbi:MAG: undecaprenyldiphospho-muramoylpentapeptide beta-N-acetylglucosaminyltransferase [Cryomorphaceae bacterium]|nr:MAG: undecaprenyldiphospho-muramoylpentapeptide beta-N-acetylglucosaminyltransferase [Cryomorphaceae bacterium]|tara:strand:- start:189 stop:1289 length:1101 start_codon:yes stop_codon:yes gene_type:complete